MTQMTDREIREAIAEVGARLRKAAEVDQARREAARKRQLDDLARQVIAAHDQLVEKQIASGVRKTRPTRRPGMSLAEQLQDIADEASVAKRRPNAFGSGWM